MTRTGLENAEKLWLDFHLSLKNVEILEFRTSLLGNGKPSQTKPGGNRGKWNFQIHKLNTQKNFINGHLFLLYTKINIFLHILFFCSFKLVQIFLRCSNKNKKRTWANEHVQWQPRTRLWKFKTGKTKCWLLKYACKINSVFIMYNYWLAAAI